MKEKIDGYSKINRQIMWNRLIAVVEEQAQTLLRTAFSTIVRECGDLSAGVFDLQGRMIAQAVTGTPGHINSMAASVRHFIDFFPVPTMKDGDVYVMNDPWKGSGHRNDFVVTTPIFYKGKAVAIFSCTSHMTDIGGLGFGPDAKDVYMEGLGVPFLKLFDQGELNTTLIAILKENSRLPVDAEGDLYSLANCNEIGGRRLIEMMQEFDLDDLGDLSEYIINASRDAVLNEISKLPKGSWDSQMVIDGYDEPITLSARLTISDDGIVVDYSGSSPMSPFGINVPLIYTTAYSVFGLSNALSPNVPNNAGSLSAYSVVAPEGCILNALSPAPVSSRHIVGQMLPDVVFGCLTQAVPDKVPAEGTSCIWLMNFSGTDPERQEPFFCTVVTNGGVGARPGKDGLSATAYPSGIRGTPIEIVETTTPLLFWKKEFSPDSAGVGQWRGGLGLDMEIQNTLDSDMEILASFDRLKYPPRGRAGGGDGKPGYLGLKNTATPLKGKGRQRIPKNDRLVIRTSGGGGLGAPGDRPEELVRADLRNGLITAGSAAQEFDYTMTEAVQNV